ncbi:MAG: NADH-quinone oxidoreductase subunit L [Anaerolineaceae bacterium]|nr:NADH-quinone oxidoreductase subunit L [Anaerolineaceae bacterium]
MNANLLILLTILIPWLGAAIVWLFGDQHPRLSHSLAILFSALAGGAALLLIPYISQTTEVYAVFGGAFGAASFIPDAMGVTLAIIATVIGCLAVIFSVDYMHGDKSLARYYSMVLFFIGGMAGLVLTSNMMLMFFFWEITALCSYGLISFNNDDPKAVKGGIKALLITGLGGVGLLVGALLSSTFLGSVDLPTFLLKAHGLPAGLLAVMGFGFLAAAAAKSAQFPFHTWLPDAMEAPTPISALIHAATMVNAGVYLLARFYPAFEAVPGWKSAVVLVGVLTAFLAAWMALTANDLKRVLAYSTISQLGFMVYAVGTGSIFASQFHLFSHSIFKALLFLAAGAVIHAVGTRDMLQMGGLGKKMPFVRAVFMTGAFALAGIPILNGFWSKELILEGGLHSGPAWAFYLMVFVAGMTALYTVRCVHLVFFGKANPQQHVHKTGAAMKVALLPLAIGAFVSWLVAGPMMARMQISMPWHEIESTSTWHMTYEILTAPETLLALVVIFLGASIWRVRKSLGWLFKLVRPLDKLADASFGFEAINRAVVRASQGIGEALRFTQTGELAWNVVGIAAGLILILAILTLGA